MSAQLSWFLADGVTPAPGQLNFGYVGPGQQGTPQTVVYRNTGDAPATNAVLMIAPVGPTDLELWLTGQHGPDTFDFVSPLSIGTVLPGDGGSVTLNLSVPSDAPNSSRPLMAQPGIAFDLAT